jgi:hypothetical protein
MACEELSRLRQDEATAISALVTAQGQLDGFVSSQPIGKEEAAHWQELKRDLEQKRKARMKARYAVEEHCWLHRCD